MAVAPLSGPLVIAEPQGGSSSIDSKKHSFSKDSSKKKKKNRYLLKRRDPHPTTTQMRWSESVEVTDDRMPMPSRPPLPPVDADKPTTSLPSLLRTESPCPGRKPLPADSKQGVGASAAKPVVTKAKKEKIKKRLRLLDDHDNKAEVIEKKKKLSTAIDGTQSERARTLDTIVSAPKLDLERLDWPDLLHDLSALALDPYYGIQRNAASIARHVFLKFRSAVYKKSLFLSLASDANDKEAGTRKPKQLKEKTPNVKQGSPMQLKEKTPNVKQGSPIKRFNEPSNAGTKRPLSDGPEESSSAKRIKKLDQLKPISSVKKDTVSTATDLSTRQEPLPPKKFSPTNLIMKFPPNKTLPSISQLKARFVRFGKLVVEGCRVNWEEHVCRVQFEYKVDALRACKHARDNDVFGNVRVSYSVKEVELPSEPGRPQSESRPESSSQPGPENGSGNSVARPTPSGPLKSILKKPGKDVGKEGQHVKFNLHGDGSKSVPTAATVSVGVRNVPLFSSPPPPSVPVPKPTKFALPQSLSLPKPTSFLPPSQATTRPMPSQHSAFHTFENRPHVKTVLSESDLCRQVQRYGGGAKEEGRSNDGVDDVAHVMLSLLLGSNEIMNRLKSLPRFVLYCIDP